MLSYIAICDELLAINRSGQLVKLAPELPSHLSSPFAFDVCDDRLYVLQASYDDDDDDGDRETLELLSLTLEGRPTQRKLTLGDHANGNVRGAFSLSASSEGIYISGWNSNQVRKVSFAG